MPGADIVRELGACAGVVFVVYLFLEYMKSKKGETMSVVSFDPMNLLQPGETIVPIEPQPVFDVQEITLPSNGQIVDYNIDLLGLRPLHAKGYKGQGVVVAVVDTGVAAHSDLQTIDRTRSKDYTGSTVGSGDVQGHGTHCAGIVSADDNSFGVLGMAPDAMIVSLKALNDRGSGLDTWSGAATQEAQRQGIDITSNSYGASARMGVTERAALQYVKNGGVFVAAAGNGGPGSIDYPGAVEGLISVGAVDANGNLAGFSSENQQVDVYAGGVNVLSLTPRGGYVRMSGTSMACPAIAGALACCFSALDAMKVKRPTCQEILDNMKSYVRAITFRGEGDGIFRADMFVEFWAKKNGSTDPMPPVPPKSISWSDLGNDLKSKGIEQITI